MGTGMVPSFALLFSFELVIHRVSTIYDIVGSSFSPHVLHWFISHMFLYDGRMERLSSFHLSIIFRFGPSFLLSFFRFFFNRFSHICI